MQPENEIRMSTDSVAARSDSMTESDDEALWGLVQLIVRCHENENTMLRTAKDKSSKKAGLSNK